MPDEIYFRSLRSSSSGNCLMLWSERTTLMIDCGVKSQRDCHALLDAHSPLLREVDAALITHAHSDHICYSSLRTLAQRGIPLYLHDHGRDHLESNHDLDDWEFRPKFSIYSAAPFAINDFEIHPFSLLHEPSFPNFGFVIRHGNKKVVIATDFYSFEDLVPCFADADFIFVECNHDLELLRRFPNYASRFHMSNPKTAKLLRGAIDASHRPPGAVMLGHISRHRNTRRHAVEAVKEAFAGEVPFMLYAARLDEPSSIIAI